MVPLAVEVSIRMLTLRTIHCSTDFRRGRINFKDAAGADRQAQIVARLSGCHGCAIGPSVDEGRLVGERELTQQL